MDSKGYRTRQRALILEVLTAHRNRHLSADEVTSLLESQGEPVGRATVYRALDRLVGQGIVCKYAAGDGARACYQLIEGEDCHHHHHLLCTGCGTLLHVECDYLDELTAHVLHRHGFVLDPSKTVLYGLCEKCAAKPKR